MGGEKERHWKEDEKRGEFSQYSIWDADSVQTWGKRGPRTARSSCRAKRKCIAINMKTRCFHSIRFSQKLFDKVEWTAGGLQFVLVCCEKNKFKLREHKKKTGMKKESKRKYRAVLSNDERWSCELMVHPKTLRPPPTNIFFSMSIPKDIIINKDNQLLPLKDQHSLNTSSLSLLFLCVSSPPPPAPQYIPSCYYWTTAFLPPPPSKHREGSCRLTRLILLYLPITHLHAHTSARTVLLSQSIRLLTLPPHPPPPPLVISDLIAFLTHIYSHTHTLPKGSDSTGADGRLVMTCC